MGSVTFSSWITTTQGTSFIEVQTYTIASPGAVPVPIGPPELETITGTTTTQSIQPVTTTTATTTTSPAVSITPSSISVPTSSLVTSSTAATSTAPTNPAGPDPGFPAGAVVGGTLGGVLGGLLIGAIIAFYFLRRRYRQKQLTEYAPVQYASTEKDPAAAIAAEKTPLEQFLLDPRPEKDIVSELQSLNNLVQQHAEHNYHLQPIQYDIGALVQALAPLGIAPNEAQHIASLALDPRTRYPVLQYVILRTALDSSSISGHSQVSLLPPFASSFTSAIAPTEPHRGNHQAVEIALNRWRQLSAFLIHPNRSDRTSVLPTDATAHQAQQLASALSGFLRPFAEDHSQQEYHLSQVILECAKLGFVIFSQPSEYCFRYENGWLQNEIVTCPGLDRLSDETGRRYPSPQNICAPIVQRI